MERLSRRKRRRVEKHKGIINMKPRSRKPFRQLFFSATLLLTLAACTTYPVTVSTETEQKAIWIQYIQFGEYRLLGGSLGGSVGENTGRGRSSVGMGYIKIPETATYRWKKSAHYTKSKYFPVHEYTVQLPQEMPELKPDQKIKFLFLIKEDNTVTVEVFAY